MKNVKNNILVFFTLIFPIIFLFKKLIFGNYLLMSGDSLAPLAIKQSINNTILEFNEFPIWFPYIFSGMPTVHSLLNINNYYFPHKIISVLHQFGMPWFWNFMFHYIFASIGMYLLLRYLKQNKITSIFSAILFSFSPYMIAYLVHGHGSQIMTAAYIPWIVLFLFRIYNKVTLFNFTFFSILIGLQLQRGHIQIAYYTWMMIGLFFFIMLYYHFKNKNNHFILDIKFLKQNLLIIFSLVVGFLLSISIYLPVLNYSKLSVRGSNSGGFGIENATQWSLNFNELSTFFYPFSYGFGGTDYWGYLPFTDFPNYIGIIVFMLAVIGFIKSNIKREYKLFFFIVAISSLLISFGKYFLEFYSIFYNYFPFFNKFRTPIFIIILFQFSIYIFAGCGLSSFIQLLNGEKSKKYLLYIFSCLLLFSLYNSQKDYTLYPVNRLGGKDVEFFKQLNSSFYNILSNNDLNNDGVINEDDKNIYQNWTNHDAKLYYSYIDFINSNQTEYSLVKILETNSSKIKLNIKTIRYDYFYISFMLFIVCLMILLNKRLNIKRDYIFILILLMVLIDYYRVNKEIFIPSHHNPHRKILQKDEFFKKFISKDELTNFLKNDNEKFRILDQSGNNSNRWAAFNIETVNGYHPAKINEYDKLLKMINNKGYYPYGILKLLNVKYIVHKEAGKIPGFNYYGNMKMNYFDTQGKYSGYPIDTYIYKNNDFNRMFFVKDVSIVDNKDIVYNNLFNDNFDPEAISYVVRNNLSLEEINMLNNIDFDRNASIELIKWSPNEIQFITKTDSPQFLFFSEIFYPGWELNGINIIETNGLFRGLIIPSGENVYTMKFNPKDMSVGFYISSFISIMLLINLLLILYNKKNV